MKPEMIRKIGLELFQSLESCRLCPHQCGVNRLNNETGICRATAVLRIASFHPHFGEEEGLVGKGGSGTIFFSHCNLLCIYCQNYSISHMGEGRDFSVEDLARMMLYLQKTGCHNINIVTPSHYLPQLLLALAEARGEGLTIPLVYNTSGFELPSIIRKLDGIVDIYLADFKYISRDIAERFSPGAGVYGKLIQSVLLEMHRQVGIARPDSDGIIRRGLMLRHLILPGMVEESFRILEWLVVHLPKDTYLNLMSQYHPCYRAAEFAPLNRRILPEEYWMVVQRARELGLQNLEIQGLL